MSDTGILGGDVSMGKRFRLRNKYLASRTGVDLGYRRQCRCGGTIYTLWRRRWYCVACGRWVRPGVGYFPVVAPT